MPLHSGPNDITDELDFSLFRSPEFSYDDLADLSLPLDDAGAEVFVDVTDYPEAEEHAITKFADNGCACKHFDGGPCCLGDPLSGDTRSVSRVDSK